MNKLLKFPALVTAALLAVSCADNAEGLLNEKHGAETPRSRTITPEQAINNVQAFIEAFENNGSDISRTGNSVERRISDVHVFEKTQFTHLSRSVELPDTLFYIVNFADSAGYVVAGAQEGMEPIYAFVESGTGDSNSLINNPNPGVGMYWEDAVFVYGDAPIINRPDNKWYITEVKKPRISAKWGQGGENKPHSYGKYFSNHTTGCVIIAAAQILYNYRCPKSILWTENGQSDSIEIHWGGIILNCEKNNGILDGGRTPNQLEEIAKLCKVIGDDVSVKYDGPRTSAESNDVLRWIRTKTNLNAPNLKDFDENKIKNTLRDNPDDNLNKNLDKIVYARAKNKSNRGHAWVIDGYIQAQKNGINYNLFHCNWGWDGKDNGYYISKVFNANIGAAIKPEDIGSRNNDIDHNYCKNYKYSIICK